MACGNTELPRAFLLTRPRRDRPGESVSALHDFASWGVYEVNTPGPPSGGSLVENYMVHSVFYCVANMPGAVADTSTNALTKCHPSLRGGAGRQGWKQALADDKVLARA
ncbi:hypothetical protein GCM10027563_27660 [Parasphingorhabdus pacifica]